MAHGTSSSSLIASLFGDLDIWIGGRRAVVVSQLSASGWETAVVSNGINTAPEWTRLLFHPTSYPVSHTQPSSCPHPILKNSVS
jgi:hypothetical protein